MPNGVSYLQGSLSLLHVLDGLVYTYGVNRRCCGSANHHRNGAGIAQSDAQPVGPQSSGWWSGRWTARRAGQVLALAAQRAGHLSRLAMLCAAIAPAYSQVASISHFSSPSYPPLARQAGIAGQPSRRDGLHLYAGPHRVPRLVAFTAVSLAFALCHNFEPAASPAHPTQWG